jgi:ADP-glucose pyrophosphorylase
MYVYVQSIKRFYIISTNLNIFEDVCACARTHTHTHTDLSHAKISQEPNYQHKTKTLATGQQHRGCIISQAVTHSLVLLKMGKIIARNMLT